MTTVDELAAQARPDYTPIGEHPFRIIDRSPKYGHVNLIRYTGEPTRDHPLVIIEPGSGNNSHPHRVDAFDLYLSTEEDKVTKKTHVTVNQDGGFRLTYETPNGTATKDIGSRRTACMVVGYAGEEWVAKALPHLPKTADDVESLPILHNGKPLRPEALITKFQHGTNPPVLLPHFISHHEQKPEETKDYETNAKVTFKWSKKNVDNGKEFVRIGRRLPKILAVADGSPTHSKRYMKRHPSRTPHEQRATLLSQIFKQLPPEPMHPIDSPVRYGRIATPAKRATLTPNAIHSSPMSSAVELPVPTPSTTDDSEELTTARQSIVQTIESKITEARSIVDVLAQKPEPQDVEPIEEVSAPPATEEPVVPSITAEDHALNHAPVLEESLEEPTLTDSEGTPGEEPTPAAPEAENVVDPVAVAVRTSAETLFQTLGMEIADTDMTIDTSQEEGAEPNHGVEITLTQTQTLTLFGVSRGILGLRPNPHGGSFKTIDARIQYSVNGQSQFDRYPYTLDRTKKAAESNGLIMAEGSEGTQAVSYTLKREEKGKNYTLTIRGNTSGALRAFLDTATAIHTPNPTGKSQRVSV